MITEQASIDYDVHDKGLPLINGLGFGRCPLAPPRGAVRGFVEVGLAHPSSQLVPFTLTGDNVRQDGRARPCAGRCTTLASILRSALTIDRTRARADP
jgi:hypothetical protein